jgi:hypothetical protein
MKRLLVSLSVASIMAGSVLANDIHSSQAKVTKVILTGMVYDPNHSVIPDARLVAQNLEGKEYWATTNDEGVYKFELPSARYRVEVNAPGFCPKRVGILVVRNSMMQVPLDFVLEIEHSDRPCAQKTMIKKERPTRKPEVFRSIAE